MAKAKTPEHTPEYWVMEMNPIFDRLDTVFYYYDGELPVEKGYIKVPRGRSDVANRLLMQRWLWVGGEPEDFDYVR